MLVIIESRSKKESTGISYFEDGMMQVKYV